MINFPVKKVGFTFLDAEKAFDNLNWEFLIAVIEDIKFGTKFIDSIKGIYKGQRSHLVINNERTDEFPIWKSTQQGCPLSPLLFILVMEVMLRNVQRNEELTGLKIKQYTYKFRAYADDVMFFSEDPIKTLPLLMEKLNFGQMAGFYVNYKKTKVICKNMSKREEHELK